MLRREAVAQLRLKAEEEEDEARNPVSEGNLALEAEEEVAGRRAFCAPTMVETEAMATRLAEWRRSGEEEIGNGCPFLSLSLQL